MTPFSKLCRACREHVLWGRGGEGGGCVLNLSQCGGEFQSIVAVQMSCCGLSK